MTGSGKDSGLVDSMEKLGKKHRERVLKVRQAQ